MMTSTRRTPGKKIPPRRTAKLPGTTWILWAPQELENLLDVAKDDIANCPLKLLRDATSRARWIADRYEELLDSKRNRKLVEQLYDSAATLQTKFEGEIERREAVAAKNGTGRTAAAKRPPRAVEEEAAEDRMARAEETERSVLRYREKHKDRKEQASVEDKHRVRRHGSHTENEHLDKIEGKKRDKQERRANGKSRGRRDDKAVPGGDKGSETNAVLKDQFEDDTDDLDEDAYHYEDFTHDEFWQVTHPAPLGQKKQHPPDKQGLWLPRWLARVTSNAAEQHLLAQLVYYFQISDRDGKVRARHRWQGHLWVYKTDTDMAAETNLTPGTVKNARERLVDRGILVVAGRRATVDRDGIPYRFRVCHYRIDWDRLRAAYLHGGGYYDDLKGDNALAHVKARVHDLEKEESNTQRGINEAVDRRRRGTKEDRDDEDDVDGEEE